jgi:hypothetical protein
MPITRNEKLVPNSQLQALFDEFESASTVIEGGGLSFQSMRETAYLEEILPDAFTVKPIIRRSAGIRLFRKALYQARREGPLTAQLLIKKAQKIHHDDRAISFNKFTLWTKIRASGMDNCPNLTFNWADVSIRTVSTLPKWLHIEPFHNSELGNINPDEPKVSGYIILSCQERLERDAVDRMLDALSLFMSLMNIYETRGSWTIMSGRNWTAGQLRMGPYQFVYKNRKFGGNDRIWYEPSYNERAWLDQLPDFNKYLRVSGLVRKALRALESHSLKQILVSSLQLAQDAFESRDGNHRLMRFWSALEKLYVEDWARDRSNQKVIDRATFADQDYKLTKWQLSHIARLRNEHVHSRGHEDTFMEQSQILRGILTRHILHWIFRGNNFEKHENLLEYVDLPRDDDTLKAMKKIIDRRIKLNRPS